MWTPLKLGLVALSGLFISSSALSEQFVYSQQFDQGVGYPSYTVQYSNWMTYRESLPAADVASITVSGSRDAVGRTCSDQAKAQQIVDAMSAGVAGQYAGRITLNVDCDGLMWNVGSCSIVSGDPYGVELNVGPFSTMCGCRTDHYTVRPAIGGGTPDSPNWGGVAGETCSAPTQVMTVTVNSVGDSDGDGVPDDADLCPETAVDTEVDGAGCSDAQVDLDADGVLGADDLCPDTALEDPVDEAGCSDAQVDLDEDGVLGGDDLCPETPLEELVDAAGCSDVQLFEAAGGHLNSVMVDGCDSGVADELLPGGFTLADLVTEAFRSGGAVALEQLYLDGILSDEEASAIMSCVEIDEEVSEPDDDGYHDGHKHKRKHDKKKHDKKKKKHDKKKHKHDKKKHKKAKHDHNHGHKHGHKCG